MPSSSSPSLPRPRSSPSLYPSYPQSNGKINGRSKRGSLSFTPLSLAPMTTSASTERSSTSSMDLDPCQPPIMVALAGWPEPIYVSSASAFASSSAFGDASRSNSMGFEPLSGQVYDGIGIPSIKPQYQQISQSSLPPHMSNKPKSRPTSPPPLNGRSTTHNNTDKTDVALNMRTKVRKPNPIPNVVPKPVSAPNLSIFASVCPHLSDPSLGPCPFKSHPHDVRNMFPPTSHLSRSPPTASASTITNASSSPTDSNPPLSSPESSIGSPPLGTDSNGERKNPEGLTNYFPVPGAGAPKPRLTTRASNPKSSFTSTSSSAASSMNAAFVNGDGKRKGSFNDPRYGPTAGIFHKGRALPVVPSWDTAPSYPSENKGKGKDRSQGSLTGLTSKYDDNDDETIIDEEEESSQGNIGIKMEVE
ncbi:uncharacterized protein IL334_002209 [Kwoniella shivajii]|uniref:Uncharacterized protein n=1 Tax=Kwoniella shivajii TaxID=564305 RepID=A0ABZ1CUD9_9TREE|nr:hypothetical protein IL334_002209 [Kwoniella shivajii]